MTYEAFREAVRSALSEHCNGLTWSQLRDQYKLPYERACPTWTRQLEEEIGLRREKGEGRALVWRLYS
ncbi:hypothetical protein [Poriferisphaera sp. WC338]|uniref:hypothetical protein n=1 Tax=Poriferisphaera sp. WC338 TaxID=3425129 RepID=UPI003D815FD0